MLDYYTSSIGEIITFKRAVKEYEDHGLTATDLIADLGERDEYEASDVLEALGYG